MTLRLLTYVIALVVASAAVLAQEGATYESIPLRVNSTKPDGRVVVDRGSSDKVEVGDRVFFRPRDGGMHQGTVIELADRTAVVELQDPGVTLADGTKGEVLVPKTRLAPPVPDPDPVEDPPVVGPPIQDPETTPEVTPEHPPWQEPDEPWTPDQPLLAQVGSLRPETRNRQMTGRVYIIGDYTTASQDDRSDTFTRVGTDFVIENPWGHGGGFEFDGEANYRTVDVDNQYDDTDSTFRLDRLSYHRGGTRYDRTRWEAGRFLQDGMPEFGVLDGFEYGQRLDNGDQWGASVGYMPEPDKDFETGQDLQVAAFYRWVSDHREQLSFATGVQKTWHDLDPDRDLLVANIRYYPVSGWHFYGTTWVDYYSGSDDEKNSGVEVTQAYITTGHRWETGNTLDFTYEEQRFPQLDRNEFRGVQDYQLDEDHNQRFAISGSRWTSENRRLHGRIGVWDDEDDNGGDAEVGMDFKELYFDDSQTRIAAFVSDGAFSKVYGGRVSVSKYLDNGHWDVFYELSDQNQENFNQVDDQILQHRIRGTRDFYTKSGWNVSIFAETYLWDDEDAYSIGFYIQKSF